MTVDVDWSAIRSDFENEGLSLRKLGKKYGICYSTICKHSKAEGWIAVKPDVGIKKQKAEISIIKAQGAIKSCGSLEKAQRITEFALQKAEELLQVADSGAEIRNITTAIKDCVGLLRDFYGIPTMAQAESQRIAAERLEMERRRFEADIAEDAENNVIEVTFSDMMGAEA